MSHTDKDRPYWVQLNDPKQYREEDHDHRFLGKVYHYNKTVLDENGNPIVDIVPIHSTPEEVVNGLYFFGYPGGRFLNSYIESRSYRDLGAAHHERVLRQARLLISAGREKEPFIVGYREANKTVKTISRVIADHCTINEPLRNRDDLWNPSIPCSRSLLFYHPYYNNRPNKDEKRILPFR